MNAQVQAEKSWSDAIGESAAASIVEMVAALQCDYDRLTELREIAADLGSADLSPEEAAQLKEELAELTAAAGDCESEEQARERIRDDALSLDVRSEWHSPGDAEGVQDAEFRILLTTGGPAARIVGELRDGQPHNPRLEVQDWFKPWTEYFGIDRDVLQAYCEVFYFGE